MIRGNFIVLEGIDGAGTTTQARLLQEAFTSRGLPAHVTAEPSQGPVGGLIRQFLSGRIVSRLPTGIATTRWTVMALLFAADRQDHLQNSIEPNLRDGVNVICDRYTMSSLVYQSITGGDAESRDWIVDINRHARKPDLTLLLDTDPTEATRRVRARSERTEMFDDPELQRKLAEGYLRLAQEDGAGKIARIDGNRAIEEIARDCWQAVENLRAEGAPS
jgi:dTMP kinase